MIASAYHQCSIDYNAKTKAKATSSVLLLSGNKMNTLSHCSKRRLLLRYVRYLQHEVRLITERCPGQTKSESEFKDKETCI